MLWTGLLFAAALACRHRLGAREAFALFRFAALAIFLANTLRAAAVFCLETRRWPNPPWAHETVGLALFATAALLLMPFAARRAAPVSP